MYGLLSDQKPGPCVERRELMYGYSLDNPWADVERRELMYGSRYSLDNPLADVERGSFCIGLAFLPQSDLK